MNQYLPKHFEWLASILFLLTLANGMAFWWASTVRSRTELAVSELRRCESLAGSIKQLKESLPKSDSIADSGNQRGFSLLRPSLEAANITQTAIVSVTDRGKSAISKTAFERMDTSVVLSKVPLRDVLNFIADLESVAPNAVCTKLDVRSADEGSAPTESHWNADITITLTFRKQEGR